MGYRVKFFISKYDKKAARGDRRRLSGDGERAEKLDEQGKKLLVIGYSLFGRRAEDRGNRN